MVHSKQLSQHLVGGTEHKQFPILTTFSTQYRVAVLGKEPCVQQMNKNTVINAVTPYRMVSTDISHEFTAPTQGRIKLFGAPRQ